MIDLRRMVDALAGLRSYREGEIKVVVEVEGKEYSAEAWRLGAYVGGGEKLVVIVPNKSTRLYERNEERVREIDEGVGRFIDWMMNEGWAYGGDQIQAFEAWKEVKRRYEPT